MTDDTQRDPRFTNDQVDEMHDLVESMRPRCGLPDCDKASIGDKPRLCAEHFLSFSALMGTVSKASGSGAAEGTDDTEGNDGD